jgi:hypothetical protein
LRRALRPLAVLVSAVVLPITADAGANVGRIVEPTAESPAGVEPGGMVHAVARLRLPLTPPPGVQQSKAWEGWSVRLVRRVGIALKGANPILDYPARLVRIRPVEDDRYRISSETPPWLPPGRYDLVIEGPGFEGIAEESVVVRCAEEPSPSPEIELREQGARTLELVNSGAEPRQVVFEVVAPAKGPGLRAAVASANGPLPPTAELVDALWTTAPQVDGAGRARLLRFRVRVPAAADAGPACGTSIRWVGEDDGSTPTAWRELELDGSGAPVSVVWDFGDGHYGAGRRVRHRWLMSGQTRVIATAFDGFGMPCTATTAASGILAPRRGCSCGATGSVPAQGILGFFLSSTLAWE